MNQSHTSTAGLFALRRFIEARPRKRAGEQCEMCGEPISPERHAHVVNVESRALMCVCRACGLLFAHEGAAAGRFRAVPERYVNVGGQAFRGGEWDELQIPVAIAFFFVNSSLGRPVAFYPSPLGATESLLPLDVWQAIVSHNPVLEHLAPDVEALLVRGRAQMECYIVPIDVCYELVGRMRQHWKGFDGGDEARGEIDSFFSTIRERAGSAPGHQSPGDAV